MGAGAPVLSWIHKDTEPPPRGHQMYQEINPYTGQDTTIYTAADMGLGDDSYQDTGSTFRDSFELGFLISFAFSLFSNRNR